MKRKSAATGIERGTWTKSRSKATTRSREATVPTGKLPQRSTSFPTARRVTKLISPPKKYIHWSWLRGKPRFSCTYAERLGITRNPAAMVTAVIA